MNWDIPQIAAAFLVIVCLLVMHKTSDWEDDL
jgi:hypothetical protein